MASADDLFGLAVGGPLCARSPRTQITLLAHPARSSTPNTRDRFTGVIAAGAGALQLAVGMSEGSPRVKKHVLKAAGATWLTAGAMHAFYAHQGVVVSGVPRVVDVAWCTLLAVGRSSQCRLA